MITCPSGTVSDDILDMKCRHPAVEKPIKCRQCKDMNSHIVPSIRQKCRDFIRCHKETCRFGEAHPYWVQNQLQEEDETPIYGLRRENIQKLLSFAQKVAEAEQEPTTFTAMQKLALLSDMSTLHKCNILVHDDVDLDETTLFYQTNDMRLQMLTQVPFPDYKDTNASFYVDEILRLASLIVNSSKEHVKDEKILGLLLQHLRTNNNDVNKFYGAYICKKMLFHIYEFNAQELKLLIDASLQTRTKHSFKQGLELIKVYNMLNMHSRQIKTLFNQYDSMETMSDEDEKTLKQVLLMA
jgi:hypothetical protein